MILTAATPTTTAMILMRISRAMETAEGDNSTECLIFKFVKVTACLTPTSEKSINGNLSSKHFYGGSILPIALTAGVSIQ